MAIDMYMKVEGMTGESQDSNHKGWTDVLSFNWALHSQEIWLLVAGWLRKSELSRPPYSSPYRQIYARYSQILFQWKTCRENRAFRMQSGRQPGGVFQNRSRRRSGDANRF